MTHAPEQHLRTPRLRAAAFGLVSAGTGVAGHAWSSSTPPDLGLFAVAALAFALIAWLFPWERMGPLLATTMLATTQLLLHAVSMLSMSESTAHAHGHVAVAGGSAVTMLLVHGAAVLLGALVLLGVERLAWRTIHAVVVEIARWVRQLWARDTSAVRPATCRVGTSPRIVLHEWYARSRGRRGPPNVIALTH